jgi:uncharacterized protein (TIGR00730 family)
MNICVFCGSSKGTNPRYADAAITLGKLFAQQNITLIYGGGKVGLMGVVADAVMQHGGKVIGIIPDFLMKREVGHRGITQLEVVDSMHERKKRMADLADGFIALPGGWGTLEELAEILTWRQLTLINDPVAILNTEKFFDPLLEQMNRMTTDGFLRPGWMDTLHVSESPEQLLTYFIR